ncbi:hypothetical protein ACP275_14G068700 [Erythranthe tilingii]
MSWRYERNRPEVGEIVMIEVKRRTTELVYVTLLDYQNALGSIMLSKLSTNRPNPNVARVINTSHSTIYLTGKKIPKNEIYKCWEKHRDNRIVHSVLEEVAKKMEDIDLGVLYTSIGWPLHQHYGRAISAFRMITEEPRLLMADIDNDDIDNDDPDVYLFLRACSGIYNIGYDVINAFIEEVLRKSEENFEASRVDMETAFGIPYKAPPTSIYWREKYGGVVVDDQKDCDSCSMASVCALVSYQLYLDRGEYFSASVQHLIDHVGQVYPLLVGNDNNVGCQDCNERVPLAYIERFGVCLREDYPFQNRRLMFDEIPQIRNYPKIQISGWGLVPKGTSFKDIMRLLAQGPIIGTMVVYRSFDELEPKVYYEGCDPTDFDDGASIPTIHSILLVGGGDDEERGEHFEVHNSWGDDWAYKGGAKVAAHLITPYYFVIGARLVQPEHQTLEMRAGVPVVVG